MIKNNSKPHSLCSATTAIAGGDGWLRSFVDNYQRSKDILSILENGA